MEMETNGNVKGNENATWMYLLNQVCKCHHYVIYKKYGENWKISDFKIHLLSQINKKPTELLLWEKLGFF